MDHHKKIAYAVKQALRAPEALRWRHRYFPSSVRWDDGPCVHVAYSIKRVWPGGRIVVVDDGCHWVYQHPSGYHIDGHGSKKWPDPHPDPHPDPLPGGFGSRGSRVLVRLMRASRDGLLAMPAARREHERSRDATAMV